MARHDTPLDPIAARALAGTPITPAALRRGDVSYHELRAAGVESGTARRLRREYSLVWDFRWRAGETDLGERASVVSGLSEAEREWVAASDAGACERCGATLVTYELGGKTTTACENCGHADVSVGHESASKRASKESGESNGSSEETWADARERFRERSGSESRSETER